MMEMDGLNRTGEHLIYLISCALRGAQAKDEALGDLDPERLFALARSHSVSAMVCMALEKTAAFGDADPAVKAKWLDAKNKAIRKSLLLDAECAAIMEELERAEIWHMPLKGSVLKNWYPQYGMREMADCDILFDGDRRGRVRELFLERGYTAELFDISNHDVYHKPPVYNFEMHAELFSPRASGDWVGKYVHVKERLLPDEGKKYRCHFTPEDFYVFVIAHAYKHYSHSGTGIRTLADIFVMNQRLGPGMDWDYVNQELASMGLAEYEQCSRLLTGKIFGEGPEMELTAGEREMLLYYLGASTYGNTENRINNELRSMKADGKPVTGFTKLKYLMQRVFPGREWFRRKYPFVYRHPILLPAIWIWRLFTRILPQMGKARRELSAVKSFKE